MDSARDAPSWLPPWVGPLPADLVGVVAFVGLADCFVFAPVLRETVLRALFGAGFVLFVPGYAIVAALFPGGGGSSENGGSGSVREEGHSTSADGANIDILERVVLSFGLSIAIVMLLGLGLHFTPWGVELVPVVVTLSVLTLTSTAVAVRRRRALPDGERFRVPLRGGLGRVRAALVDPDSRADAVLTVMLVVGILLAVGTVAYGVGVPKSRTAYTEFYVVTENESSELVMADYPTNLSRGESASLVVGLHNHEHERVEYTVVVELQRVRQANDSTHILADRELRRFRVTLADDERWRRPHTVRPTMTGEGLRLQYLLYRGEVPADPHPGSADRELHLLVNVSARG
jgi:uncharacterized membrane protein